MNKQEFLLKYYGDAKKATEGSGLFPETLLTQLIGESGYNLSKLATVYKNYFGIKANSAWKGAVTSQSTNEYINGKKTRFTGTGKLYRNRTDAIKDGANTQTLFRAYKTTQDGFKGWVQFLQTNPRYKAVFTAKNPIDQFKALHAAGYATAPTYSSYLTSLYNSNKALFNNIATLYKKHGSSFATIAGMVFFFF